MKLEEIIEQLQKEDSSYVVTVSYLTEDKKSVLTKCLSRNFPVNDLATARSEASKLIYNMQESHDANSKKKDVIQPTDMVDEHVKGLLE